MLLDRSRELAQKFRFLHFQKSEKLSCALIRLERLEAIVRSEVLPRIKVRSAITHSVIGNDGLQVLFFSNLYSSKK